MALPPFGNPKFRRASTSSGVTNTISRQRGGRQVQGDKGTAVGGPITSAGVDPGHGGSTPVREVTWGTAGDHAPGTRKANPARGRRPTGQRRR